MNKYKKWRPWDRKRLRCFFLIIISFSTGVVQAESEAEKIDLARLESNLSEEKASKVKQLYQSIQQLLAEEKYDQAFEILKKAEKLAPDNPILLNLRGAIYAKKKDYIQAAAAFKKAIALLPDSFGPQFNLVEMSFLQKNYPKARRGFVALLMKFPQNELLRYKIYLCYLLEGSKAKAKGMLKNFDQWSLLPVYYFAHAAQDFHRGKKAQAQEWIQSAQQIYSSQKNALFTETLCDLGWISQEEKRGIKDKNTFEDISQESSLSPRLIPVKPSKKDTDFRKEEPQTQPPAFFELQQETAPFLLPQ